MPEIDTSITSVTVYPDRARLVRKAEITLDPGIQNLGIAGLPVDIDPDSVRATASGTAKVRLLGVQVGRSYYIETPAESTRELETELESLQDALWALDLKHDAIKNNRAALSALATQTETYATALASGEMTLEQELELFRGLRGGIEELDNEQQSLSAKRRDLERRIAKVKNELDQLRNTRPPERYDASIEVEVFQAGSLSVELSYVVSGAGWKPIYDLRLSDSDEQPEIEVGYLAQVSQRTGEAWEGVALSLSTARPALAGILPELDPWYIQPFRPLPPPAPVPMMARMAAPMAKPGIVEDSQEAIYDQAFREVAEEAMAEVETTGAAVTYSVPGNVTIPPDGADHKVTVARFPLPPKLDYVATPKIVEAAYRRARLVNDSPYIFLPGQANLFAGEEFIGTAQVELTAPQGEIELYLGVDDRLKVERELKRRDVDKRLIGSRRRIVYGYEIDLENLLPLPVNVTLQDQIPVARHEEIKVRLDSIDPRPAEQTDLNLLKWELSLTPKQKRSVRYEFSVEYPQAMQVTGLP